VKRILINIITSLVLTFTIAVPNGFAGDVSPLGSWQTTSGESRYEVTSCKNGKAICAKLVWLRSDARTPRNLKHLNKIILSNARAVQQNKWRGSLRYGGENLNGSLTLVNSNKLQLNGCKFVFCKTINFKRI